MTCGDIVGKPHGNIEQGRLHVHRDVGVIAIITGFGKFHERQGTQGRDAARGVISIR